MKKMFMFLIVFILIMTCGLNANSKVHGNTKISGVIPNHNGKEYKIALLILFPESIFELSKRYVIIAKGGIFSLNFEVNKPRKIVLEINGKPILGGFPDIALFIEPGDDIHLQINDLNDLLGGVKCSGRGSEKLRCLKELKLKVLEGTDGGKQLPQETVADDWIVRTNWQLKRYNSALAILGRYQSAISKDIFTVLKSDIVVDTYAFTLNNLAQSSNIQPELLKRYKMQLPKLEELFAAVDNQPAILANGGGYYNLLAEMVILLDDYFENGIPIDQVYFQNKHLDKYYNQLDRYLVGKYSKDFILLMFLQRKSQQVGFTEEINQSITHFIANVNPKGPYYSQAILLKNQATKSVKVGQPIPNFTFYDVNNKPVRTKELEGKVLLIDFWYTGCNGCLHIKPYLDTIANSFSNKDFKVLSISIDGDSKLWKRNLTRYSSDLALHLYTGGKKEEHPFIETFHFNSYPSLFLIGKKGELLSKDTKEIYPGNEPSKRVLISKIEAALVSE